MKKFKFNIFNLSILTITFTTVILLLLINSFLVKTFNRDIEVFLLLNKEKVNSDIRKITNYYFTSISELFFINDLLRLNGDYSNSFIPINIKGNSQATGLLNNLNFTIVTFNDFSLKDSKDEINNVLNSFKKVYKNEEKIRKQLVYVSANNFMVFFPQKSFNNEGISFIKKFYTQKLEEGKKEYKYNPSPILEPIPVYFDKFKNSRIDATAINIPNEKKEFHSQLFLLTPLSDFKTLFPEDDMVHDIIFTSDKNEVIYSSKLPSKEKITIDKYLKSIYGLSLDEINNIKNSDYYVTMLHEGDAVFLKIVSKSVMNQRKFDLYTEGLIINSIVWLLFSYLILVLLRYREIDLERIRLIELQNNTDELTKLCNRKAILKELDDNFSLKNLSIALVDIDKFKSINDNYGHVFGDLVIQQVTKLIKRIVGNKGSVGRYGGEEFIVILPNTTLEEADILCKKVNEIISSKSYILMYKKVTVSIGVTYKTTEPNSKELIEKADKNLYIAKNEGRDRVISS